MRDPLSWSFPIGRLFGITVRVHLLFLFFLIAIVGRGLRDDHATDALVVCLLTFGSVLLHEFGHCFAARSVDGDATEILLWPLGGLASVEVPQTPWANFVTTAGGPLVNLVIFTITGGVLLAAGLMPPMNPLAWSPILASPLEPLSPETTGALTAGTALAARLFYINWLLFWFNILLVGFPLDGGRILQCILWPYVGFRQATVVVIFTGWIIALIIGIYALLTIEGPNAYNMLLLVWLALFIYVSCKQQALMLEAGQLGDESAFGYDFSQGYTSLEREQTEPRPRKPGFWRRWLARRAERKRQRELEQRQAEERRVDELLAKVQESGMQSLTDEERRFLTRVSAKYRHRQ